MQTFLIGLAAGCFGGLVGLGGGIIMIPLMTGLLKLTQRQANGTSIAVVVCTGVTGTAAYALRGDVDLIAASLLAATAMITSNLGARFAHGLPDWQLKRGFGAFLALVTILLLSKPFLPALPGLSSGWPEIATLLATGAFTGFLSGMMGVGGGTIMVPVLILLIGHSQHLAQGTSMLAMVPIGLVGSATHWKLGNLQPRLLPWMIPGAVIGTAAASLLAGFVPQDILRWIFAAVLAWMVVRYLRTPKPA